MEKLHDPSAGASEIQAPPSTFLGSLRYLGPGLILSAAIVGSGELIATTILGAEAGFVLLWMILFGCVVKVSVQVEYGRYCILHGLPTLQAWNRLGHLKLGGVHWTVYIGAIFMLSIFAGQAGVLGGTAQVAYFAIPAVPLWLWVLILVAVLGGIVSRGLYDPVERIAITLNAIFVVTILYCVAVVLWTPYAYTWGDMAEGFTFQLSRETLALAMAAFGITGVAAGEIALYPYWCLEKGYARWTGPRDDTPEWRARARGWTRVMIFDALFSMVVYTVTTVAFYILGASVLHVQDRIADGPELVLQLSAIFTEVLGEGTRWIFMLCAFTVLFSTVFANVAGFSRMWTDFFGICGWVDLKREESRRLSIFIMVWVFLILCATIYFIVGLPLLLVVFMGISNSLFLIVVGLQTLTLRYRVRDDEMKPSLLYDVCLWISLISIGLLAVYFVYTTIT